MQYKFSLEEFIKYHLVPRSWYASYRHKKEYRKGEPEFRMLPFLVDKNKNSIDVGANKGTYTVALAKLSKKVFAFEPNPKMFAFLKKNSPSNAEVFSCALSDKTRQETLRIPLGRKGKLSNQGASLNPNNIQKNFLPIQVDCKKLDDFNLKDIGFIKIDVEGFEKEVLMGAEKTLKREKPTLLIEMEERHTKRSILSDIKWIEGLGYKGFALFDGKLQSLEFFDSGIHHNDAWTGNKKDYIFNFIFLAQP
ncbi:MAG: FkbM family methyltransferase [Alphaproteobacteria bacterium]